MRRIIGIAVATAVMVVGGGAFVLAQTTTSIPACADIVGGEGGYLSGTRETSAGELEKAMTSLGELNFTMYVGGDSETPAVSCPDVTYTVVVLDDAEFGTATLSGQTPEGEPFERSFIATPNILTTVSMQGDGLTNALRFTIPVNDDDDSVCVYLTTTGTPAGGTSDKNGAAFDGGPATTLLDRAPDGGAGEGFYCEEEDDTGTATSYR